MLDKNPDRKFEEEIAKMKDLLEEKLINLVLCNEAFVKTFFISKLVDVIDYPIIYLDFDLMYSGYVVSRLMPKKENVSLFYVSKNSWNKIVNYVLKKVSMEKCLVVIDSLNGLSNFFEERDSGRIINTYHMLLGSLAVQSESILITAAIAKRKDNAWVLSPTGRHIIETNKIARLYVQKKKSSLLMEVINNEDSSDLFLR